MKDYRALRTTCLYVSYRLTQQACELPPLFQRRNDICEWYFIKILNPEYKLPSRILNRGEVIRNYNLRNDQHIDLIIVELRRGSSLKP